MEDSSQWPLYLASPHAKLGMRVSAQMVSARTKKTRTVVVTQPTRMPKIPNGDVAERGGLRTEAGVIPLLMRIADSYPPAIAAVQGYIDVPRNAFNLSLLSMLPRNARIGDIGGGLGLFSPGCAALGFNVTLVDDLRDAWQAPVGEDIFDRVHRRFGVTIVNRDVVSDGVDFEPESFDAFTVFDTMEHWHNSPKRTFHQLMAALKPNGLFIISAPNCVNLRKRITVPFGVGKWTAMRDWYEVEHFRSHVRERDVADFRRLLRLRPSLCSDIYLVGQKAGMSS